MVLRQNYGKEIDLWAIGIFAYEMSNYNPPFSGPEIKDKLRVKRLVQFAETNRNWKNPNLS
jgi:serine/threonine protein kinase